MLKYSLNLLVGICVVLICGCQATYNVNRASHADLASEGTVVFTRPAKFAPLFGSYSLSEFVEIVYERSSKNEAGQMVVELGIRNRGPVSWTNWDRKAPERITLKIRSNFYLENSINSPIVYSTNQQEIVISRGETYAYKVTCPNVNAMGYQIILGD
ncbi:MAG: hypothetical protein IJW31_00370 [Lentisphaeria bacterium]|nr:hypothetical protein [Lentisphaeria bacterium]MBR7127483.1 hypothetical protein [Lentisphaeria bacterium]